MKISTLQAYIGRILISTNNLQHILLKIQRQTYYEGYAWFGDACIISTELSMRAASQCSIFNQNICFVPLPTEHRFIYCQVTKMQLQKKEIEMGSDIVRHILSCQEYILGLHSVIHIKDDCFCIFAKQFYDVLVNRLLLGHPLYVILRSMIKGTQLVRVVQRCNLDSHIKEAAFCLFGSVKWTFVSAF